VLTETQGPCHGFASHDIIPCVFLLGGKAFVVGAVVGFASSSTFFIWSYSSKPAF
jgi:hypothetical protein